MFTDHKFTSLGLLLLTGLIGSFSRADEPPESAIATAEKITKRKPTRFIRVLRDEFDTPISLQTATAKYVLVDSTGETTLEVSLESVIHIADRGYFQGFNQRFRHYDAVLYELVAPPEKRVPDKTKPQSHPLALVQRFAAEGLGLTHQVDQIDYQASNLVHSDLSPAEMLEAQKSRGDDPVTILADTMLHWVRQTNKQLASSPKKELPQFDLSILTEPDGAMKLRRLFASQFSTPGQLEAALAPRQRTNLIDDRNRRALEVFQKQLDAGHRRIAFFWGAAHMQDFEQRLILDYGLKPAGVRWRNAWDLRDGTIGQAPLQSLLERTLRATLEDLKLGDQ